MLHYCILIQWENGHLSVASEPFSFKPIGIGDLHSHSYAVHISWTQSPPLPKSTYKNENKMMGGVLKCVMSQYSFGGPHVLRRTVGHARYTKNGGGGLWAATSSLSSVSFSAWAVEQVFSIFCSLLFPHKTLYSPPTNKIPPKILHTQQGKRKTDQ